MAKVTSQSSKSFGLLAGLFVLLAATQGAHANLLSNPGFESDPDNQTTNVVAWNLYGPNVSNQTSTSTAHSGTNYFKVFNAMIGSQSYSGCYQDYISGPGATYSADGWVYTAAGDIIGGQNTAWIEVTFRDANANILALYRTELVMTNLVASGVFPAAQWHDLQITNQYDINSFLVTNTVSQLVAPPGTVFLRYQIVFQGDAQNSHGSTYFDDLNIIETSGALYGNMNIVWDDEFSGSNIDTTIWTNDLGGGGWGNNELETYTTTNAFVTNGILHIAARRIGGTTTLTSARMKTQGLFSFTYGRLEWRAQMPNGVGFWPALWLMGTNIASVNWPTCGEIDVLENPGTNVFMNQSSIHYGGDATAVYNFTDGQTTTNFHTYTLDWTTNALLFYVDGHLFETQTGWGNGGGPYPFPFNQPFFLLMNFALGGNYVNNPPNASIGVPGDFQVDYVRIYRATDPLLINITKSGSTLLLSWPSNIVCTLQGQTNSPNGLSSNWFPIGTTTNQMSITPINGNAFFRLSTP